MRELLNSIYRGLGELVLPESCIGCGIERLSVCSICIKKLTPAPNLLAGENFKLASSLIYDELSAEIVIAAKERGTRIARKIISGAITAAALALLENHSSQIEGRLHLLWIPTSSHARRKRGGDFLRPIASQVAAQIQEQSNLEIKPIQILRINKGVRDQSQLSAIDRTRNLHTAFAVHPRSRLSGHAILIDDVVTTGSTLREAIRALNESNLTVIGAATACASRLRKPIR